YGGGPRICIGFSLAQLEMKLILAHLLRSYQWDVLPNQRLDTVLFPSVQPKDGVKVFFRHWHPEHAPAQAPAPERMDSPADKALKLAQAFGPGSGQGEAGDGQPAARCPYSGALLG
ncbi:MAG TPA: cytochrome P450, partial [Herpetosiphonaceae bacterium]|nr:cytochrome P450 [Herpetosiphonaceae bacterium]